MIIFEPWLSTSLDIFDIRQHYIRILYFFEFGTISEWCIREWVNFKVGQDVLFTAFIQYL